MRIVTYGILSIINGAVALAAATTSPDPVCIIGAGPAGLTAAHDLEAKGRSVVIFDRQPLVGGKCQSYYENNAYHPLGAVLFTNGTYRETLKIIRNTTVSVTQSLNGSPRWSYDLRNGSIVPYESFTPESAALLAEEIARYSQFWNTSFAPIGGIGYRNPIPGELTVSTLEWFNQNGYRVLPVIFNLGMFAFGYGDIRQTPILYMMQFFQPEVVTGLANITPRYITDFHEVMVQYAESIRGPIHLSTTVSRIDRSGPSPVVTYSSNGNSDGQEHQTCSSLILAFPPTVSSLTAANLDVTPTERTLFSEVELTNYFSGAVNMEIPANQLYYANSSTALLPPDAAGEPVGLIRFFNQSRIATTWSWGGSSGQVYTRDQAYDLLLDTLSRINKADPANADSTSAVPITPADVRDFRSQEYFPRVSGEQLAAGWYLDFDRMQGQQKTYYVSGLNAFEIVEFSVRAAQDVVGRFF